MTEDTATIPALDGLNEFEMLKERAKSLGINVGNMGLETLRKKVADKLAGTPEKPAEDDFPEDTTGAGRPLTEAERKQQLRKKIHAEQMALVRCRIYNLNPGKRDLQGEIITVGNKYLGTVRKFIPFGEATDGGYHIPRCIYNNLIGRKFQQIQTKKGRNGQVDEMSTRMVPEYSIEVLPPLTEQELRDLATRQAAAARLGA